jgi:outer membrane protein OmpA-like peptidoglycan-associated protein
MKHLAAVFLVASCLAAANGGAAPAEHTQANTTAPDQTRFVADTDDDDAAPTKDEKPDEPSNGDCRESKSALLLTVDRKTVSLEEGRLRAKMDGPICNLRVQIIRKDGTTTEKSFQYEGPEQELTWDPVPRDQTEKIEIRITAKNGAYQAVLLIPWSVKIDHQEVNFDSNKAVIRQSEISSLKESFTKAKEILEKVEGKGLGPITLFIAGHTDTRGSNEHNLNLSRSRAEAIATWFQKEGLCVPIAFEGFGETALKKLTANEVDEPANRRVDYILSVEPPVIKKGASPAWKLLSKGCP